MQVLHEKNQTLISHWERNSSAKSASEAGPSTPSPPASALITQMTLKGKLVKVYLGKRQTPEDERRVEWYTEEDFLQACGKTFKQKHRHLEIAVVPG
jgi:hypothetical protein